MGEWEDAPCIFIPRELFPGVGHLVSPLGGYPAPMKYVSIILLLTAIVWLVKELAEISCDLESHDEDDENNP